MGTTKGEPRPENNNKGPAVMECNTGTANKDLEVVSYCFMPESDVREYPLDLGDVGIHECQLSEDRTRAFRVVKGKKAEANPDTLKQAYEAYKTRKARRERLINNKMTKGIRENRAARNMRSMGSNDNDLGK